MVNTEVREATRQAEAAFLASLLFSELDGNILIEKARVVISLDDFAYKGGRHYRIYQAMLKAPHTDQITVAKTMNEMGILQSGDCVYLCELIANCCTPYDWEYHAQAVKSYSNQRRGIKPSVYKGLTIERT